MARVLAAERIDVVWSSPLRRALETAEPIAAVRDLSVRRHDGLLELGSYGPYVPLERTDDPSVLAFHERLRTQATDQPMQQFRRVVLASVREILDQLPSDATALVSCHGGVMSAYASDVLGISDVIFFVAAYAGFSRFTIAADGTSTMVSLNEHAHLAEVASAQ